MSGASLDAPSGANARLAAAGLTATTILWLTAGLSMLQPRDRFTFLRCRHANFRRERRSVQSTLGSSSRRSALALVRDRWRTVLADPGRGRRRVYYFAASTVRCSLHHSTLSACR